MPFSIQDHVVVAKFSFYPPSWKFEENFSTLVLRRAVFLLAEFGGLSFSANVTF